MLHTPMTSAICYGCVTSFASLAYQYGAQVELLVIVRGIVVALVCALLLAIRRESLKIRRIRPTNWVFLSVTLVLTSYFQLTAIKHISVGLTVVLFFMFPVLVTLHDSLWRGRSIQTNVIVLSIVAFSGVAISTGANFDQLNWRGVTFAGLAAVSMASSILIARKSLIETPIIDLALASNLLASALALTLCLLTDRSLLLSTGDDIVLSLVLTMLVGILFAGGFIFQLHSIKRIGSTFTSMVLNFEPIIALVAASLIIGEEMKLSTAIGGGLIVLSVLGVGRNISRCSQNDRS